MYFMSYRMSKRNCNAPQAEDAGQKEAKTARGDAASLVKTLTNTGAVAAAERAAAANDIGRLGPDADLAQALAAAVKGDGDAS